jgi:Domain of unknown function (DUF4399)
MRTNITRRLVLVAAPALVFAAPAFAGPTPAPDNAYIYLISPRDGRRVKGPFWCRFGLRNMGVAPAGMKKPDTGHHHLFVDVDDPLDPNVPIPQDKHHLHFGAGQTEALIDLPPGHHKLQLVLGDAEHLPFNPPVVSKPVHITVLGAPHTG